MLMYALPIMLVVLSNVVYHVCQKSIPKGINPFSSLFITYLTATIITVIAFQFYNTDKGFFHSIKDLNFTSLILGVAIVGLEFGYMMAYKAGWNISIGSLVANIIVAVALIPIGIFFFKEGFGVNKIIGMVFCIVGLILINKK